MCGGSRRTKVRLLYGLTFHLVYHGGSVTNYQSASLRCSHQCLRTQPHPEICFLL
jgi:hypothetical protein